MSEVPATIGRIVIYRISGTLDLPAIVTAVEEGTQALSLTVFQANGSPLNRYNVPRAAEQPEENTWHWPERV
jgi:hypothetical protein